MPDRWVVVSLEGLATAAIGAYGSSWNETPAIDRMAAYGTLWDRVIASHDDPVEVLRSVWGRAMDVGKGSPSGKRHGRSELLLNAGPRANQLAGFAGECGFDQCTLVEAIDDSSGADEIEATAFAKLLLPVLERINEPLTNGDQDWSMLWVHGDSLIRCWDAPRWLFPVDDEGEQDAAPEDQVEWSLEDFSLPSESEGSDIMPQTKPPALFDTTSVPRFELAPDSHPDLITSWMQTYGCQIRLIDQLLSLLIEAVESASGNIGLALIGTSGFSLGQNGWIGHRVGAIRSPQIHLPAILFDRQSFGIRIPGARSIVEVADWLWPPELTTDPSRMPPEQWASDEACKLNSIATASARAERVLTTDEWFFVRDADDVSLFNKPDDRDDMNDVADRCRDVVAEFDLLP